MRGSVLGLGLLGALAGGERGVAQQTPPNPPTPATDQLGYAGLTVRPYAMATGTRNPPAGEYVLDSVPDYLVTVPPQCVGPRRCPLLFFTPPGSGDARSTTNRMGPVTNKYGIILLAGTAHFPLFVDAALQEVLRRFAIDPGKLAMVGHQVSASAYFDNVAVFSRIAPYSGGTSEFAEVIDRWAASSGGRPKVMGPTPQDTTQFIMDMSLKESPPSTRPRTERMWEAGSAASSGCGKRGFPCG